MSTKTPRQASPTGSRPKTTLPEHTNTIREDISMLKAPGRKDPEERVPQHTYLQSGLALRSANISRSTSVRTDVASSSTQMIVRTTGVVQDQRLAASFVKRRPALSSACHVAVFWVVTATSGIHLSLLMMLKQDYRKKSSWGGLHRRTSLRKARKPGERARENGRIVSVHVDGRRRAQR